MVLFLSSLSLGLLHLTGNWGAKRVLSIICSAGGKPEKRMSLVSVSHDLGRGILSLDFGGITLAGSLGPPFFFSSSGGLDKVLNSVRGRLHLKGVLNRRWCFNCQQR
ncbi:uncharacterized protein BDV14DRAFT_167864 [Aspergillus stella-maris]|uniref:uncharacterized protein n=1 Tax=Aspergillus stella-maris TaxID=1810926 RepID=UPI003CCCBA76